MSFNATFPVGLAVNWQAPSGITIPNAQLKNWLLDTGSLTERVQSLSNHFSLELLGQHTQIPHDNELSLLHANGETSYQAREILLCGDHQQWVFARSIIPQAFVDSELSGLGREPLGKRLFNDTRFTRSAFQLCTMPASQFGMGGNQTLWGRRSLFTLDNYSMIVAEVFLPASPAYGESVTSKVESEKQL
ncbi:chorismate--pyruvate lyase family protein [Alteromonas mediterranea]|uniref:Probable chorismate pyruvate-lyase n=1 Tax=Alteromonas mediterranea TaxID=314275 RepID=A0AAC9ACE6_9ALTE|nr:chorismate lyase [Alteromonas mediterranea]AGP91817.1 chorismate pyruvate lyase [Alteromonas mediterranea U8]MEA3379326.1 chorismate lyase [Pseudomonadota bacterium]AFV83599.1 chorismate pyruvate lyase [Alteromonas mediterranea DE1]AGP80062.1 chorismate pyruvate lyase [Alteromonas mediterranea MED64]AGP83877.1 chorismate pyruvate lyase [Alteromonas mediterranea U4]